MSEIFICLADVVIIGLEGWSSWLRPLIVVGAAVFLVLVWAVQGSRVSLAAPRWLRGRAVFQRALNEIRQFRAGAVALLHPRVLVVQSILGALYLTVAGTVLYVVLRSLGMGQVTLGQALGVYFFSLAFFLISPVSVGMLEVSGVAALVVVGVDEPSGVGAMLIYHLLRTAFPLAIALAGLVILRDEVRAALRERPG